MPDFESLKQRIELLERKQERILNDIHDERAEISSESEQPIRLAYTTTSGTYPTDPATVFEIVFCDASFTETAGNRSIAAVNHSLASPRVGYSITGKFIPEDTLVSVFRQNGKYWILPYFPESSSTPGTEYAEYQANTFYGDKFYYDSGANTGTEITDDPGWLHPLGTDLTRQRVAFPNKNGPDIGVTHTGLNNRFDFSDKGFYRLTYTASVVPLFYVNGLEESPPSEFYLGIEFSGFENLWGGSLNHRLVLNTDFHVVGNTTRTFGNVDFGWGRSFTVTTFFEIDYSAPNTWDSVYIDLYVGFPTGMTDYGAQVGLQNMIVQKLFNASDA